MHSGLLFDLFDLDGSGSLDRNEVLRMMLAAHARTGTRMQLVLRMLDSMDENSDGVLSVQEFLVCGLLRGALSRVRVDCLVGPVQALASRQPLIMETLSHMFAVKGDITTWLM